MIGHADEEEEEEEEEEGKKHGKRGKRTNEKRREGGRERERERRMRRGENKIEKERVSFFPHHASSFAFRVFLKKDIYILYRHCSGF